MGEILRNLRIADNKRSEDIAKLLGISVQSYYRYENGLNEPTIERLKILADYYKVTLDFLVGRRFANDVGYLSEQDRAFMKLYNQLDEIGKIKTSAYVAGLLTVQK